MTTEGEEEHDNKKARQQYRENQQTVPTALGAKGPGSSGIEIRRKAAGSGPVVVAPPEPDIPSRPPAARRKDEKTTSSESEK